MLLLMLVTILSHWLAPIPDGEVLRGFSPPHESWAPGHRGVDFAADVGEPVQAIGPGVVVFAGKIAGKAVISIDHPDLGLRSTYEPVTAVVHSGDHVQAGQVIGSVSDTGGHCSARCVHLGLKGPGLGEYRDPLDLLGSGFAVLKPLTG